MKKSFLRTSVLALLAMFSMFVSAQMQDPVHFKVEKKQTSPNEVSVIFSATIDAGWHVYSTGMPSDGPQSAVLTQEKSEGAKAVGALKPVGKEIKQMDEMFGMELRFFEKNVKFIQKYKITGKKYRISGYLTYGACCDGSCMPPTNVDFDFTGDGPADAAEVPAEEEKEEAKEAVDSVATDSAAAVAPVNANVSGDNDLWTPVIDELQAFDKNEDSSEQAWYYVFFMGLVGGFIALVTPCVWPIIPMTVSFFLKRAKDKKSGIRDAIIYGVSIIVIYLALGLSVTLIFGASSLNALATSAVFNVFFCLLLIVFAVSFFGWFELTLPSSWTNSVDSKASKTSGLLSIFLMAFTLTLVSFSCTGPIIGFLLVEVSTSGSILAPAIGMFGFALALALPFTLFAMFPAWLNSAPKSGSWMNTVKIVLGFVELAFALKFFSVADLAYGWHLLDREVFLSLWIVIFGALGLYLLGFLKFQSDFGSTEAMPVPCIMLGLISIAFAIYMIPGLWGAPCKAVSAFAPPMATQDFNLYKSEEVRAKYFDYEEGMAAAKAAGKPALVDFTGFGCVNCRKMEAAVWTDPTVAEKLQNDYVLISLFVDDKTPLAEPIEVKDANGNMKKLRTVGDKWSYLQSNKFGANAQPFYVTVDNEGHPLGKSAVYNEDISLYIKFLDQGIENYAKKK